MLDTKPLLPALPCGLYESLMTEVLQEKIRSSGAYLTEEIAPDPVGIPRLLRVYLGELIEKALQAAAEREERLVSAAQMEARKTILAAKQAVMEEVYAKALDQLRNLPQERCVEVLTSLLEQAAPEGKGEVLFSAQDRDTVGRAAVDAANAKTGGRLTISEETASIPGGFILRNGSIEVNCAFDTLIRLQKTETAGQVAQRLFG